MVKKALILAGLLLVALAVACGGSSKSSEKNDNSATTAATREAAPTSKAAPSAEATASGSSDSSFNPLSFLTGDLFGADALAAEAAVVGEADPDLKAVLLTESDLPSDYQAAAGDMGFTMDMPDGQMKMAMRSLAQGGSAESGPVVMSAAMTLPASELSKFNSQLDQLDQMSTVDLEQQMTGTSALGMAFKDFSVKKTDIGDGGVSMHIVMDMSGLAQAFGGSSDQLGAFQSGIAFDAYVFKHGDRVLMTMSMWPAGQDAPVDAEALAKKMDSRA